MVNETFLKWCLSSMGAYQPCPRPPQSYYLILNNILCFSTSSFSLVLPLFGHQLKPYRPCIFCFRPGSIISNFYLFNDSCPLPTTGLWPKPTFIFMNPHIVAIDIGIWGNCLFLRRVTVRGKLRLQASCCQDLLVDILHLQLLDSCLSHSGCLINIWKNRLRTSICPHWVVNSGQGKVI